jgi:hypothetical protein
LRRYLKELGAKGGNAAKKRTAEERSKLASRAATARWKKDRAK